MESLGADFPWVSSGQSWGAADQQMELQPDSLLPEAPFLPTGSSSFMRRGFSAEALPRHFGMQQVRAKLSRWPFELASRHICWDRPVQMSAAIQLGESIGYAELSEVVLMILRCRRKIFCNVREALEGSLPSADPITRQQPFTPLTSTCLARPTSHPCNRHAPAQRSQSAACLLHATQSLHSSYGHNTWSA